MSKLQEIYWGNLDWLQSKTFLLCRTGSHAYGTNLPTSDEDFKGICCPPKEYFLGFTKIFEQAEQHNPDLTIYDIRKYFRLAADNNPNILEMLYGTEEDHFPNQTDKQFRSATLLLENRDYFLSKKVQWSFSGYAMAQLKRLKSHRNWLLDPPKMLPTRKAFNLPESTLIPADQLAIAGQAIGLDDNFIELLRAERAYLQAQKNWVQYQEWKKSRNPQRAEMEARFGYDGKHAMHLVRLMRMAKEILETRRVVVKRPDYKELLSIRNGAWTYDQLIEWAERSDEDLKQIAKTSSLPETPNREALNHLCQAIVETWI